MRFIGCPALPIPTGRLPSTPVPCTRLDRSTAVSSLDTPVSSKVRPNTAVRVDEHVDVGKDHSVPSITSSNAAESSRSIPGRKPLPPVVVSRTRGRVSVLAALRANRSRNDSSMIAVSVVPNLAASRLASRRSAFPSRTVVRMTYEHMNGSSMCQHVVACSRARSTTCVPAGDTELSVDKAESSDGQSHALGGSFGCAVRRRHSSTGTYPVRQLSLQPVAVGADDGGNDIGRSTLVTKGHRGRLSERTGRNA